MEKEENITKTGKLSFRQRFFKNLSRYPNIFIIYRTIAIVLVWSGIWGLSDELIFPDNPFIRGIIVLAAGVFMLYIDDYSLSELVDVRQIRETKEEEASEEE